MKPFVLDELSLARGVSAAFAAKTYTEHILLKLVQARWLRSMSRSSRHQRWSTSARWTPAAGLAR